MIKVENIEVFNFEGAIRGMRNPLNSWDKSDSFYGCTIDDEDNVNREHHKNGEITKCEDCGWYAPLCWSSKEGFNKRKYIVGKADLDLMHRLFVAGQPHRKYLRQIFVSMDITAPLYWWKEFDTYKVGTTANSCSTMHKIHDKEFTLDDFSHEHLIGEEDSIDEPIGTLSFMVDILNMWRDDYLRTKDKDDWWQMIQLLPSSYNQKRTITMNYENVFNILEYRQGHKLDDWRELCEILKDLPYVREIGGIDDGE